MKKARVTAHWTRSVSSDVQSQRVTVVANGVEHGVHDLPADVNNVLVGDFSENDMLNVTIVVNDGTHDSEPAQATFLVPDLNAPSPVSNVNFTYEVVEEVE